MLNQERGLEKEKEAASALLKAAKAAEATTLEEEHKAEAVRCGTVSIRYIILHTPYYAVIRMTKI